MFAEFLRSKSAAIRTGLLETLDKFTDEELGYRTSSQAYSVAETMLHIAHEEDIEVRYGLLRQFAEMPPVYDAQPQTLANIRRILDATHLHMLEYLVDRSDEDLQSEVELTWGERSRPLDVLWHVMEHEIHHRGELSLTLGILGRQGLDA